MAAMSTKSRQVIYGGRIIGARIRAEGAQEAAQKAVREADRAAAELWSIQMEAHGGPAQPSPTIAQCLNGGYGWLQVKCHRCEAEASIPLEHVRRPGVLPKQTLWTNCLAEGDVTLSDEDINGRQLHNRYVRGLIVFGPAGKIGSGTTCNYCDRQNNYACGSYALLSQ